MADHKVQVFKWAGYKTYSNSSDGILSDDDDQLDWFGQDTGAPETLQFDGSTHQISGGGTIETTFKDSETGEEVTENLVFYSVENVGWVFSPAKGSSFSDGDQIKCFTKNAWTDRDGVNYKDVVCFTPGCQIATKSGLIDVADLKVGDLVQTADNGLQPIRWIGRRDLSSEQLAKSPFLRPITIAKDAFGEGMPHCAMQLSPQHRLLVTGRNLELHFAHSEALAPAKGFISLPGVNIDQTFRATSYIHILFDRHEVIFSNGVKSESLFQGKTAIKSLSPQGRREIAALFPELLKNKGTIVKTARICLKPHEIEALNRTSNCLSY